MANGRTRYGTPSERLWSRVTVSDDGCWVFSSRMSEGYGRLEVQGRSVRAHRLAYELLVGPIPEGLTLDHLCRNRACVNPAHLEPVTGAVNSLRGLSPAAINASKTHCVRGHELTPENTYIERFGKRRCVECVALRWSTVVRKGRTPKTACPQGHSLLDPANVIVSSAGHRRCRTCQNRQRRESRLRRKAADHG